MQLKLNNLYVSQSLTDQGMDGGYEKSIDATAVQTSKTTYKNELYLRYVLNGLTLHR